MAGVKKFLFLNPTEGYHEEQAADDELALGKITLAGVAGIALDVTGDRITGLPTGTPAADSDAASKAYVDSVAAGLDPKDSVRVATIAAQVLASDFENGDTIDGVVLATGDRVLIKDQASGVENGIYTVNATGAPTRAVDFDTGASVAGAFTFVEEGTLGDTGWVCTNNQPNDVVGTDNLSFTQFTGASSIIAGDGLLKTGNTLDVRAGDGIQIASDFVAIELDANPGLALNGTTPNKVLAVLPDTLRGLDKDGSGLFIDLAATNPGLEFSAGDLQVSVVATGGIERTASGLQIKIDDTPDTLDVDGDGLKVVGLPSLFKINDSAVSANVTAANLNELTGGGSTTLHSHPAPPIDRLSEELVANEGVAAGDPVVWSNVANEFNKGDAGNDPDSRVMGVAEDATIATATGTIVKRGRAVNVLAGATPGTPYYLQAGGGVGTTIPAAGNRVIRCGYARSATDLEVLIHDFGKKAA